MNLSDLIVVRDYDFKLPAEFKVCEGCVHFDALFKNEINCSLFGRVNGVQQCIRKIDGRDRTTINEA